MEFPDDVTEFCGFFRREPWFCLEFKSVKCKPKNFGVFFKKLFQANLKIQTLCGLKFHEINNSNKANNSHEVGCREGQYLQA